MSHSLEFRPGKDLHLFTIRHITILKSKSIFYEFIIKNCEFIATLLLCEISRFILIVAEENSNLSFAFGEQIKNTIHYFHVGLKCVFIDLLPFDFFPYPQFFKKILRFIQNGR